MSNRIARRSFLKSSGAIGAGFWLGVGTQAARATTANEKLNLAVVGLGGQGGVNLKQVGGQNIVALCDVDDERAGKAYETFPRAKKFFDYRKMFDEMESRIDGVVISTPDHSHFHPAWLAIERGKHVYLEKPLAHCVWEVRELTKLAAAKKVATQMGAQRHAIAGLRSGVEIVRAGTIGAIKEVHSWIASDRGLPTPTASPQTVPPGLKWDLWLGPAAQRPYSKDYVPYNWRFWWDFGTGDTGNWGCHILDIPFWALGLKYPTRVEGSGPPPDPQRTPKSLTSRLEFAADGKRPAVTLHWYQGTPPILKQLGLNGRGMNNLFIGADGMLLCGFGKYRLLPEDRFKDFKQPAPSLPKSPGFHQEWFNACRGGEPASCNFDYSGPLAESVLLANIAYRVQGSFDWDAAALAAKGNADVAKFLRDPFRKGWEM
jgi:predicted dehydrogenase